MRFVFPRFLRRVVVLALVACAAAPGQAQQRDPVERAAQLKATQVEFMMRGARRRFDRYRARQSQKRGQRLQPVTRSTPPPPESARLGVAGAQVPAGLTAIATDYLVNNRTGDHPAAGQCEVSIAAHGSNLVAAWNDGQGYVPPAGSTQGFAYSTDNGVTWTDGGAPPVTGGIGVWASDPVVTVNEKTGAFYYAALCEPTLSTNGIGVVKGLFTGGTFSWGTPQVVIQASNSTYLYDKEWIVADSLTGNLYLIYARFDAAGDRIDFQYNTSDNTLPWSGVTTLSAPGDDGYVQGGRLAMGPAGEIWAAWNTIGVSSPYADFLKIRRINPGGGSVGAEVTAVAEYTNFGSGAPGFNRGMGFAFPGLAADRSTGPHRGRVHLTWNESVNFWGDGLGWTGTVSESEPNNTIATADAFTLGQRLMGSISPPSPGIDLDYWQFSGTQGQTLYLELSVAGAPTLDAEFVLYCTDDGTRLAYSEPGPVNRTGLIVFTLPASGTYKLRVAPFSGSGPYVLYTDIHSPVTERARDHRDVFTSYSDGVGSWSTPVRVNADSPYYDNWLPEIAVATNGDPYLAWYDWRDSPAPTCGGASIVYLSRSTNGGVSWPDGSPVSNAQTQWSATTTNISPNQGDYISLFANQTATYVAWSDGRLGNPDVYMAAVNLAFTAAQLSLVGVSAEPERVRVSWYVADGTSVTATAYRRTDLDDWRPIATLVPDGTGLLLLEDRDVSPGMRYHYRLGVPEDGGESFTDEVAVEVPLAAAAALAIQGVRPNPTEREMWVTFSLPDATSATLELIDVSGRRVRERTVTGPGWQMVDLADGGRLAPGVYLVRLSQQRRSVVARASVVR